MNLSRNALTRPASRQLWSILVLLAALTFTAGWAQTPADLVPVSVQAQSHTITFYPPSPQSPTMSVVYGITNQGSGIAAGTWSDRVWISTNSSPEGITSSQDFGENWSASPLASGEVYWRTNMLALPQQSGTYWLFLQANGNNSLYEENLTNNQVMSTSPVTLTYQVTPPDLVLLSVTVLSNHVTCLPASPQYPTVPLVYAVSNQGPGLAAGGWDNFVWVSTNGPSQGTFLSYGFQEEGSGLPLPAGGVLWRTNLVLLPQQSGTNWITLQVNGCNDLYETTLTNNTLQVTTPVTVTYEVLPPDLMPLVLLAPTNVTGPPGTPITVVWGVTNQGAGAATGGWIDRLDLTPNPTPEWNFGCLGYFDETNSVAAGGMYWRTNTLRLPVDESGTYYLSLSVNESYFYGLYEPALYNNTLTVPLFFNVTPRPDLAPLALQAPALVTGLTNLSLTVTWGVTNQGPGSALPRWYDNVHLTSLATNVLGPEITGLYETNSLPPGQSYWRTNTVQTSVARSGMHWLRLDVDEDNALYEVKMYNNWARALVMILETNDVALYTSITQQTVMVSKPLTFLLQAFNAGPAPATGVRVTNTLPAGVSLLATIPSQGSCTTNNTELVFDFGTLAGGAIASAEVIVTPAIANVTLTNHAVIVRNEVDVDLANNFTTNTVAVSPLPPPNDAFASRQPLVGLSNTVSGSNLSASREPGEPAHANRTSGASVWWSWTAPLSGTAFLNTYGSSFAAVVAVYTGENVSSLTAVASQQSGLSFPTTAGTTYQIAVDSADGSAGSIVLNLQQQLPDAPVILLPPENQTLPVGANASFTVTALGSPRLTYQWARNGLPLPGATNTVFTLTNVQTANAGVYSITVSNLQGTASAQALLNVGMCLNVAAANGQTILDWTGPYILQTATNLVGPYLDLPGAASPFTNLFGPEPKRFFRLRSAATNHLLPAGLSAQGQFLFQVSGLPGYNYVVQASTNLEHWVPILTNTAPLEFVAPDATSYRSRFYRTRLAP